MADVLVLCYHAVSERWPAPLSVTPEALREQLGLLVRRGFRGATFAQAVGERSRGRRVVVTFDDAFDSVHSRAAPILRELGLPGTLYVPTDYQDDPGRPMRWDGIDQWLEGEHAGELRPMGWERVRELAAEGWEIGSHTRSHPRLTTLSDRELAAELEESKAVVAERLGQPCRTLAYPYGDHDDRVVEATRRAGYEGAGTLPSRLDGAGPHRVPRVGIYHGDDLRRYRLKVSRPMRLLRATPLWPAGAAQGA